jgi:hypothetical protein
MLTAATASFDTAAIMRAYKTLTSSGDASPAASFLTSNGPGPAHLTTSIRRRDGGDESDGGHGAGARQNRSRNDSEDDDSDDPANNHSLGLGLGSASNMRTDSDRELLDVFASRASTFDLLSPPPPSPRSSQPHKSLASPALKPDSQKKTLSSKPHQSISTMHASKQQATASVDNAAATVINAKRPALANSSALPRPLSGKHEQPVPLGKSKELLGAVGAGDDFLAAQRPLKKAKLVEASRPLVAAALSGLDSGGTSGGGLASGTKLKKKKKKKQQSATDGSDDDLDDIFGF